jgi:energy-coupling factor transport system substrate-specific component
MRKSHICVVAIAIIGVAAFILPVFFPNFSGNILNWGLAATLIVILTILAFFFEFESALISSKDIALIAMLGTISAVARVPFAAIPSVQPCTFFIICSGYVFGPLAGFMVGAVTALVSNFFLGQGPWTPFQMLAWGLVGVSAAYFRKFRPERIALIIFGIVWGYLYGWIMNTWFWASMAYPLTFKTFFVYQVTSVWFDTLHAISNAVFLGFFGVKTIGILERFQKRFHWSLLRTS